MNGLNELEESEGSGTAPAQIESTRPLDLEDEQWDEFEAVGDVINAKDFHEVTEPMPEHAESESPISTSNGSASANSKTRVTELRRRIEERLESKRIALEYDYLALEESSDDFIDATDTLQ